jgi:hypothetical protein
MGTGGGDGGGGSDNSLISDGTASTSVSFGN